MRKINGQVLAAAITTIGLWASSAGAQVPDNWVDEIPPPPLASQANVEATQKQGNVTGEAPPAPAWIQPNEQFTQAPQNWVGEVSPSPPPPSENNAEAAQQEDWTGETPPAAVPARPNVEFTQEAGNWVYEVPAGRGFFAHVDAIWLNRVPTDGVTVATLNSPGTPGRLKSLGSEYVHYNFASGVRVQAGMMLNQVTQLEGVYFGINNFNGSPATITRPAGPFALNSAFTVLNQTPTSFRASGQTQLQNAELNFRRRGGACGLTNSVLVGFRYLNVRDQYRLDAAGPPPTTNPAMPLPTAFETTSASTLNNIFALQAGGSVGLQRNYFHLTGSAKGFVYADFYHSSARNVVNDPSGFFLTQAGGGTYRNSTDIDKKTTAGVGGQVAVDGSLCLTENIILHAGYQLLVLSDVALGARQLPAVRTSPARGARLSDPDRGHPLDALYFHGPSAGLEIRW